jgi:hypothetical protein
MQIVWGHTVPNLFLRCPASNPPPRIHLPLPLCVLFAPCLADGPVYDCKARQTETDTGVIPVSPSPGGVNPLESPLAS